MKPTWLQIAHQGIGYKDAARLMGVRPGEARFAIRMAAYTLKQRRSVDALRKEAYDSLDIACRQAGAELRTVAVATSRYVFGSQLTDVELSMLPQSTSIYTTPSQFSRA